MQKRAIMGKKLELAGKRFGNVTVLEEHPNRQNGKVRWKCLCHLCGNEFVAPGPHLKSGNTSSCCGDKTGTHNMSKERPYRIWQSMKERCFNENSASYHHYGGRGIIVCEEWLSFEKFWEDMNHTYSDNLSMDRIDVDGNYCKENCRWTTNSEQRLNCRKRPNRTSRYRNVHYSTKDKRWVASIVIPYKQLRYLGSFLEEIDAAKAVDEYILDNNLPHHLNFKEQ